MYLISLFLFSNIIFGFEPASLEPISSDWNNLTQDLLTLAQRTEKEQKVLDYCDCIPLEKRVQFATTLARHTIITKSRDKKIEYISFGSGNLLQDYLNVLALMHVGYATKIHLIDLFYNQDKVNFVGRLAAQFNEFLTKDAPSKTENPYSTNKFETHYYPNWTMYALHNKTSNPDILLCIDPVMDYQYLQQNSNDPFLISMFQEKFLCLVRKNKPIQFFIKQGIAHTDFAKLNQVLTNIDKTNQVKSILINAKSNQTAFDLYTHPLLSFDDFVNHTKSKNPYIGMLFQPCMPKVTTDENNNQHDESNAFFNYAEDFINFDLTQQAFIHMLHQAGYTKIQFN